MSLFGGGGSQSQKPQYTGVQIQTSTGTLPIPLAWGANRGSPNIFWTADFQNHPQKQKTGKGMSPSVTSYTYSASLMMGLAEGVIYGVGKVWKDKDVYASYAALGFSLFTGTDTQTAWGYLTSAHPDQALTYRGIAYLAAPNYDLGQSASISNHNFEVLGKRYDPAKPDVAPELIVVDFLTDPVRGVGVPSALLDMSTLTVASGSNSYGTYCQAMGFGLSPLLASQEQAAAILNRWGKLTNTAVVWTGYSLRFVPYGDETVTANGVTYTPAVTPVYVLTNDDFVGKGNDDPVTVSRIDPADAKNSVTVNFKNRANDYNAQPCEQRDQNACELYGVNPADAVTADEICTLDMAGKIVSLMLQRSVYQLNTYKFKLGAEYCLLEPMDVVTVILTNSGTALDEMPVRITKVQEGDDGTYQIEAEEFSQGVASAATYARQIISNNPVNQAVVPGAVNDPVIIAMRNPATSGNAELWVAASGGANWGGCEVWISFDNTTYQKIGEITSPARQGVTTASLAAFAGTNPDTAHTLAVNLAMSRSSLDSASATEAANGVTLAYVGGELLSYQTATMTGANAYNLTSLYRGLYGTTASTHASGAAFARLDDNVFKYAIPTQYQGASIFMKFPSFNIFKAALEDISTVPAYTVDLTIKLAPPTQVIGVAVDTWRQDLVLRWTAAALADSYTVRIYDTDGVTLLATRTSTVESLRYTNVEARADGVRRAYKVTVTAVNAAGSGPASAVLAITNPAPPAVQNANILGGPTTAVAVCDAVSDPDLSGYVVFYSTTSGFDPRTSGTSVRSGTPQITVNGLAIGTYYGVMAAFDLWSSDPALLNLGAQQSFAISAGGGQTPTGTGGGGGDSTGGGGGGYSGNPYNIP